MNRPAGPEDKPADKAEHGYRNEVSWDGGQGHQPYANQGEREPEPGAAEYSEGDRGVHSGENLEQLEEVKRKP
ncbi:hypothetical protein [Ramlibacter rhizophilus]|uniref:Uncharacterized protein n=1 Tax=Ramlibacter rhizophilus TaxID=1781167 RepID=A0A4Z0BSI2_9BURK|nr:hypothetical protein [Ramlibacter rhizophilus]TFZ01218.1 hypothetical protein EZ242_07495 [Ramlibacter rhizophilus]